jgi:FecR protein
MRLSRLKGIGVFILAAMLSAPAWATNTDANTALPGTLNYVEGQAAIGGQNLDAQSIGSTELQPGQTLTTESGKAEVLLTPGVFLRVGDNSSVRMISPSLTRTEVAVDQGQAMVEVSEIYKDNDIRIMQGNASTRILKTGLYAFDANQNEVRVFDGQARVFEGDQETTVKGGHEVALNAPKLKARGFDKSDYEQSDLYRWSSLRSSYLAEANQNAARIYASNGWYGPGWIGAGWYWDPWFSTYTFIPADGIFYSPFGWGFYSPLFVYRAPAFYGGGFYHHFGPAYRPPFYTNGFRGRPGALRGPVARPPVNAFRGFHPAPVRVAPFHAAPQGRAFNGFHGEGFHSGFGGRR